jgi:hypothetical protein
MIGCDHFTGVMAAPESACQHFWDEMIRRGPNKGKCRMCLEDHQAFLRHVEREGKKPKSPPLDVEGMRQFICDMIVDLNDAQVKAMFKAMEAKPMSNDPEYDAKIREFSRGLKAGEHDEALIAIASREVTDEAKIDFIKANGWSESCLYDDFYNPPDPSFYKDGQLVFNLNDSYMMAALANFRNKPE